MTKKTKKQEFKHLGKTTHYPETPDQAELETFANPAPDRDYIISLDCPEFTTLCPITGQPDFARLEINYAPAEKCIESKALKLYLFSFRNIGSFHEAVTNRIRDDLVKAMAPKWLQVNGYFNARGGIAITVRVEYGEQPL